MGVDGDTSPLGSMIRAASHLQRNVGAAMVVLSAGACCQRCLLWYNTDGHKLVASCAVVRGLLELSNTAGLCSRKRSDSEASCGPYCGSTAAIGPYL